MSAEQEDDPGRAFTCSHFMLAYCRGRTYMHLYNSFEIIFLCTWIFSGACKRELPLPNDIPLDSMLLRSEVVISGFYCRDVEYCKLLLDGVPKNHRISAMIFRRLSQLTSEA